MGKFKMPTVQQFLMKKRLGELRKEPVWVYLEREMRENVENKPYNEKVGSWLKFLRELRYYFYLQKKKQEKRLIREVGPSWYYELSSDQRDVLMGLKANIHQDLIEDLPIRIRKSLSDLGMTLKLPKNVLIKAMKDSEEDPGVFIWNLYTAVYKRSPSELRAQYDMNSMILMSSLVFIDLDECVASLEELTRNDEVLPPPPKKPQKKNIQPDVRYGEYLQKCYIPCYSNVKENSGHKKPPRVTYKFRLRSESSYERLCMDRGFLDKRMERNRKEQQVERICTYKFWEAPSSLRNTNPKMAAYMEKLNMFKKKAKARFKAPYKNVQYAIAGVAFTGGLPRYILQCVAIMPTGYIPINGGIVNVAEEITAINIVGFWKYPKIVREKCDDTCDCLVKWESKVKDYLKESRCKCGHLYDYYNEGKATEKYFYQATRHVPFWIDKAKVFQLDPIEDFIKDTVEDAAKSKEPTPEPSQPTISASELKEKELLAVFLADLSHTPLLIPHLPNANLLNNLQEWVRKRVHGKISPKRHKQYSLVSLRRWLELSHMDFRARAYQIPFTLKQLHNMNWSHRGLVQTLFEILLNDFVSRNRIKQLEQTRLWWSTMKYDTYPGKAFLDIFFTYMPGRMKDTFLINPYSSQLTPKSGGKTCPLSS